MHRYLFTVMALKIILAAFDNEYHHNEGACDPSGD
jgi:hypothetical protein